MIFIIMIFLIMCGQPCRANEIDGGIVLGVAGNWFPDEGHDEEIDEELVIDAQPELYLDIDKYGLAFLIKPKAIMDVNNSEKRRLNPQDMYLDYRSDWWELRMGYMILFAGTVESEHVVDIFNQRDYELDFIDPDKIGEPGMRLRLLPPAATWDILVFPYFTNAYFPDRKNRFNLFPGFDGWGDRNEYSNSEKDGRAQLATRITFNLQSVDIGFTYFNGYDKFPSSYISAVTGEVHTYYYEQHFWGLDLQYTLGEWVVKAESVYRDTSSTDQTRRYALTDNGIQQIPLVPDSSFAFIGGAEYVFPSWYGNQDLSLFLEYMYDSTRNPEAPIFRPYENDLFAAVRWSLNDHRSTTYQLGMIYDLDDASRFIQVEAESRVFERVVMTVRIDVVNADEGNFLYYWNDDDRISLSAKYYF